MLTDISQCLNKSILIGLSYFNAQDKLLEQKCLGGTVVRVDKEQGITIILAGQAKQADGAATAEFILPSDLSCWFISPKGEFPVGNSKIINPDYLVTWDVYQTKEDKADGEQQWWEWVPRTTPPQVG